MEYAPGFGYFIGFRWIAAQFRISGQSCCGVTGHFNFRYDIDITVGSILYNFTYLILCIITAIGRIVKLLWSAVVVITDHRLRALAAYLCKLWIFFDLDAPALVVGQVPVKIIQFVISHHVDGFFDKLDREKMPANIKHDAAIRETGVILNLSARYFDGCHMVGGYQLQ